jgi:DNA polymerase-3 subunit beta
VKVSSHLVLGPDFYQMDGMYNAALLDFANFPGIPLYQPRAFVEVAGDYFADLISLAHAASRSENRPILTGICHRDSTMVSTDSHRLLEVSSVAWPQPFVLPARAAVALFHAFSRDVRDPGSPLAVHVDYDDQRIRFNRGKQQFIIRLLDGMYPDVNRIWPSSSTSCAFVLNSDVGVWLRACEAVMRVHLKPAKKNRDIHLSTTLAFTKEGCLVSARNESSGSFSDLLPCLYTGPDMTLLVNAQYLADAVAHIKGSSGILMSFQSETQSFVVSNDDRSRRALVFPIRRSTAEVPHA